jgi:hypothetical protein
VQPEAVATSDPNAHRRFSDLERKDLGSPDLRSVWGAAVAGLTGEQVEAVVRVHSTAVKRACWWRIDGGGASRATVTVHVTIDHEGVVSKTTAEGDNAPVKACLIREISAWTFPPSGATTGVDLPYLFFDQ